MLVRNGKGVALRFLGGSCGFLGESCGCPELPRRDADQSLEMMGELALIREAGVRGDVRQGEVTTCLKEVPRPFDAACDEVLVRRQPGGNFELPGEVIRAEAGDGGHLLKSRSRVEVFLDVLDDGSEPPRRQRAVPPALNSAGCQEMSEQVDGQDIGQGLGGEPSPGVAGSQFSVHRPHRGPELWEVQAVERRDGDPCRIEVERLGGDPRDQSRFEEDVEPVEAPLPAPPVRGAGRHDRKRSDWGRCVPRHSFIQKIQFLWRPSKKDEPMVGEAGGLSSEAGAE